MRYTENEFTIDHIFDFIRIVFSSIFLAPFRLVNEYTKKILLLDKDLIIKHLYLALGLNIVLIITEIITALKRGKLIVSSSNIPGLVITFITLGLFYKKALDLTQPQLKVKKDKIEYKTKSKPKKSTFLEDDDIIADAEDLEEIEEVTVEDTNSISIEDDPLEHIKFKPKESNAGVEIEFDFNLNDKNPDLDALPETSKEDLNELKFAVKEDEYGLDDIVDSAGEGEDLESKLNILREQDLSEIMASFGM